MPNSNIQAHCSRAVSERPAIDEDVDSKEIEILSEQVVKIHQESTGTVGAASSSFKGLCLSEKSSEESSLKKLESHATSSSSRVEDNATKEVVTGYKNFTELCLMAKKIIDPGSIFSLQDFCVQKIIYHNDGDLTIALPPLLVDEFQPQVLFYLMLTWLSEFYVDDKNKNLIKCVLEKILPDNNFSINTFSNLNKIIDQIPYEFKKNEYFKNFIIKTFKDLKKKQKGILNENDKNACENIAVIAVKYNFIDILSVLLEGENPLIDVDFKDKDGKTPLMHACIQGHEKVVKLLIELSADLNLKNKHGETALMYAAQLTNEKIVDCLLQNNANPDLKNKDDVTALIYALLKSRSENMVECLLKNKANPDVQDNFGYTALMYAIKLKSENMVECLLKNKANPDVQDKYGHTALILATESECVNMVECLLKNKANPDVQDKYGKTALILATESECVNMVECLLKNKAEINFQNKHGKTALMYACKLKSENMVEFLLSKGAKVNLQNCLGETALDIAELWGVDTLMIEWMEKYRSIENQHQILGVSQSTEGLVGAVSSLFQGVLLGERALEEPLPKKLMPKKLMPKKLIPKKLIPSSSRVVDDKNKCFLEKILPDNNLSINTFSDFEKIRHHIPEDFSKTEGFANFIAFLEDLKKKQIGILSENDKIVCKNIASIALKCNDKSILSIASRNNDIDIINFLLEGENPLIDVDFKDKDGKTPLMHACIQGHEKVVKLLIAYGANINLQHRYDKTALMHACIQGHENIVEFLIKLDAKLNLQNSYGETALMYACKQGHKNIVKLLLENGANLILPDCGGRTALDMAELYRVDKEIIELLKEYERMLLTLKRNMARLL